MKVALIQQAKARIEIVEQERPKPGRGEVLIRVRACGVCHGDLMVQQGEFPFVRYPIVPGHEVAGVIESVGEGVQELKPGARVGLSALYSSCGHCPQCTGGDEFLCAGLEFTGVTRDGGYREFTVAQAGYVAQLPDALDLVEAAPLMCAGLTVYSGLRHTGFEPGKKVGVIGLGGLGHLAVLYARAMGGRVAVLSTSADKERDARQLGAELFINTKKQSASEALSAWEGGADVIVATAPTVECVTDSFAGLAPNGTLLVLGVGPGNIGINPMVLVMGRRRLMGSPAGSRQDLRDTLEFAAKHGIRPQVTPFPLERAGEALAQMQAGHVRGRAVLVMD